VSSSRSVGAELELFQSQEALTSEWIELLYAHLSAHDARKRGGLHRADILMFLHSIFSVPVVLRHLIEGRWLDLLSRFAFTAGTEGEEPSGHTFTRMVAVELLGAVLSHADPSSTKAETILRDLIEQATHQLGAASFWRHLCSVGPLPDLQPSHAGAVVARAMLNALTGLLSPESTSSPSWAQILASIAVKVFRDDLPRALTLLTTTDNAALQVQGDPAVESFHRVILHLSLFGGELSSIPLRQTGPS